MSRNIEHSTSSKTPYLVRAMYDWIVDNDLTPHLLVDAMVEGVEVPSRYVDDGKIVLNISPSSIRDLELGNEFLTFGARFAGTAVGVVVPMRAVLAVYARENGQGLALDSGVEEASSVAAESSLDPGESRDSRPSLRIVK